jgi:hypothetical protein
VAPYIANTRKKGGGEMGRTDELRRQHKEILSVVSRIRMHLDDTQGGKTAVTLRDLLSEMSGHIRIHLLTEDAVLYPSLLGSSDPQTAELARTHADDTRVLRETFDQHLKRWPSPWAIDENLSGFRAETTQILDAVAMRLYKEDAELLPLFDELHRKEPEPLSQA